MIHTKFKVGDTVFIKDLAKYIGECPPEGEASVVEDMLQYSGKTAKIIRTNVCQEEKQYRLDCDNGDWVWSEYTFEPKNSKNKIRF